MVEDPVEHDVCHLFRETLRFAERDACGKGQLLTQQTSRDLGQETAPENRDDQSERWRRRSNNA
jgi:hypothetical protein